MIRYRCWLWLVVLLSTVLAAYWPGRSGGYVFDDFPNIVNNTALHVTTLDWFAWLAAAFSSPASDLQRPLAMLSFAMNHYFTGLDPVPMKLTNLGIHLLNTMLVFVLLHRLLPLAGVVDDARRRWAARFVAATWAVHPINLMAVLFVVQRMESLSHTFVFGGLLLYVHGRQRQLDGKGGWTCILLGLVGGTTFGVMSKESAVLLPLYAFLIESCLPQLRNSRRDLRLVGMFAVMLYIPAVLGTGWLLYRTLPPSAYAYRDFTLFERLITEGRVVLDYLRWTLFPSLGDLSLYHDDYVISRGLWSPPSTLFAMSGMATLLAAALFLRGRRPLVALGVLWFLAAQALTATFMPLELVYEHRNYFASLGVCLALGDLLLLAPQSQAHRRIGALVAILAALAFIATTHLRAIEWSNPYRFALSEAAKHPHSPRATYALGQVLARMSDYRPGSPFIPLARNALEQSRRLPHSGILPHSALLLLAAGTDSPQRTEWWTDMQNRLRTRPIGPQEINAIGSLSRCARLRDCQFPAAQMLRTFEAALSRGPNPSILTIRGDYTVNVLGDPDSALAMWRQAYALQPTAQHRINLIKLLIATGRTSEAEKEIDALRYSGRFGQHEVAADTLELLLSN